MNSEEKDAMVEGAIWQLFNLNMDLTTEKVKGIITNHAGDLCGITDAHIDARLTAFKKQYCTVWAE